MAKEISTKIILYSGEKEEECDEWIMKSLAIARSKGWYEATETGFVADDDAKKKIDAMGVTYFTLACTSNAFRVIKNQKTAIDMIAALEERYEETEEDDHINLLEVYTSSKMTNTAENPEDWMLKIEDINERMAGVDNGYKKADAEIKIKILAGLPEEYSEVVTSEKRDLAGRSLKQVKRSIIDFCKRKFEKI